MHTLVNKNNIINQLEHFLFDLFLFMKHQSLGWVFFLFKKMFLVVCWLALGNRNS